MRISINVHSSKFTKINESNRKYYNRKIRGVDIEVGDDVLYRNREKGGTGKLRNYWENEVYTVIEKDKKVPVYLIKPKIGRGQCKRVHRNNLMKNVATLCQ